jgi:hypothetical protein
VWCREVVSVCRGTSHVACMLSQWLHVHCWLQLWILSRTPTLPADYSYDTVIAKIDSLGLNTTSLGYVLSPSAPLSLRCVRLLVPTCSGALVVHPHLHPLPFPLPVVQSVQDRAGPQLRLLS